MSEKLQAKVLVVTSGFVHPPYWGIIRLKRLLKDTTGIYPVFTSSFSALTQIEQYEAVLLYIHRQSINEYLISALLDFVKQGGGVLALHSASASFKFSDEYFRMLGGKFVAHGKVSQVEIFPVSDSNFPFSGIPAFTVKDEIYHHKIITDIRPHFVCYEQAEPIPVVWTNQYGEGRVCYAGLGHTVSTMGNAAYQQIIRAGLGWVCKNS